MKSDDLQPVLSRYAEALDAVDARRAADAVRALLVVLPAKGSLGLAGVSRQIRTALPFKGRDTEFHQRLMRALTGLRELLVCAESRALSDKVQLLLDALDEQSERAPVSAVASASNMRRKRGTASVDRQLVEKYLERLDAALGDDLVFDKLYEELVGDNQITRAEAVAIAERFVGGITASASRLKALQRVRYRHDKLKDFKNASKLIARGKTAA